MIFATFIDRLSKEQRRLQNGPLCGELPQGAGTVRFVARCPGNAESVLAHAKEVLLVVNEATRGDWPTEESWRAILPGWFVSRCPPRKSREALESLLREFTTLSPLEQVRRVRAGE